MAAGGRIRIVSDGTPAGTRVLQPNGERMPGRITNVEWRVAANGGPATAVITFHNVEVEVAAFMAEPHVKEPL